MGNTQQHEPDLADWVLWQKVAYERGELPAEQAEALAGTVGWQWLSDAEKGKCELGWPGVLDPAQVTIVWGEDGTPDSIH